MLRDSLKGFVVFGVLSAAAGYVWTTFEFPFVIVIPAAVGWYAVTVKRFGHRKAWIAGAAGGVTFTVAFLAAVFLALAGLSVLEVTPWLAATAAAGLAGAFTGWLLAEGRGALAVGGVSAAGMLVAMVVAGILRAYAPAAVDVAGPVQTGYVTLLMGVVGGVVGAAAGGVTAWLAEHKAHSHEPPTAGVGPRPA